MKDLSHLSRLSNWLFKWFMDARNVGLSSAASLNSTAVINNGTSEEDASRDDRLVSSPLAPELFSLVLPSSFVVSGFEDAEAVFACPLSPLCAEDIVAYNWYRLDAMSAELCMPVVA